METVSIIKFKTLHKDIKIKDFIDNYNHQNKKSQIRANRILAIYSEEDFKRLPVLGGIMIPKINWELHKLYIFTINTRHEEIEILDLVKNIILSYFRISEEQLYRKTRKRDENVIPRQFAYWWTRHLSQGKVSLEATGKFFGWFDHATVLHGVRTINRLLEPPADKLIQSYMSELQVIFNEYFSNLENEETANTN